MLIKKAQRGRKYIDIDVGYSQQHSSMEETKIEPIKSKSNQQVISLEWFSQEWSVMWIKNKEVGHHSVNLAKYVLLRVIISTVETV